MTAKDLEGKVYLEAQKNYFEIGVDTDGDMRYGAWQIKEIIDLTLPPLQTQKEKFIVHFDSDTSGVEIEVKLSYFIKGSKGDVMYSYNRKFEYITD